MGGPAGVADADRRLDGIGRQHRFQRPYLALGPAPDQMAEGQGGDAGGVVPAIFKAFQAFNQPLRHLGPSDDADDSTHGKRGP